MNRKFGIGILIIAFSLSSVNAGWAAQVMGTSSVVIAPAEIQELTQQMIDRDRQNRNEEIAIQGLIEENNKLTQDTLARQEDEGLKKINQTMLSYHNAIVSRDRARIIENSQLPWLSRYGDLVALTEDADAMTVHRDLEERSGWISQKYQMLTDLKDEMTTLNDKLRNEKAEALIQRDSVVEAYKKIAQQQQDKIKMLVDKLDEMDRKISHVDEILAQKDRQIELLKRSLDISQSEASSKDDMIKQQENQIALLQAQSKDLSGKEEQIKAQADQMEKLAGLVQQQAEQLKDKDELIKSQALQIGYLPLEKLAEQIKEQGAAVEQSKSDIDSLSNQIQQQAKYNNSQTDKESQIKSQADQLEKLMRLVKDQGAAVEQSRDEIVSLKSRIQQQANELEAKNELIKTQAVEKESQIKSQADQLEKLMRLVKDQGAIVEQSRDEIVSLKSQIQQQANESENNQSAFKNKSAAYEGLQSTIVSLKDQVGQLGAQLSQKQEQVDLLKEELENKITELKAKEGGNASSVAQSMSKEQQEKILEDNNIRISNGVVELPPVIVVPGNEQQEEMDLRSQIADLQDQKEDLNKELARQQEQIVKLNSLSLQTRNKSDTYDKLRAQIIALQGQIQQQADELEAKDKLIKNQTGRMTGMSLVQSKVASLKILIKKQMQRQADDLKAKDETIAWLNKVLAAAKNKAKYYQLTSQENQMSLQQVREEVQKIKEDFAQHFKDYGQVESVMASLKSQMTRLASQLSIKQKQVELLKEELENKITELKNQGRLNVQTQQELKARLEDKDNQIVKLKADIQAMLQGRSTDDRVKLAQQLIDLQKQENALLVEKNNLASAQKATFEQRALDLENKIKQLLASQQIQAADWQNRREELTNELGQKKQQLAQLNAELENKIAQEQNHSVLTGRIQELEARLADKEDQMTAMKNRIQSGQETKEDANSLKQQLATAQDNADQLKQQLDTKIAESNKMALMIDDYQKKLESKDNAYNEQMGQLMSSKNERAKLEKQITDLNTQLQAKDLSLSMVQQKMTGKKIDEYQDKINGLQASNDRQVKEIAGLKADLALARQQLGGMPSSDEVDFLRSGLKKATVELKQKDEMLGQIKANADEYEKEFKEQSNEFQSLKVQLQNAYQEINHQNEDLKYKDLEIIRLKERSTIGKGDLQDQIKDLTRKLELAEKRLRSKTHENKVEALQAQLKRANAEVKDLRAQLKQWESHSKNGPVADKLKQALDKIEEQGRMINILAQKLQDCGKSADLTQATGK